MSAKENNLALWNRVEKTDPKHTKKAKIGGMNITAIAPQYQILNATREFGEMGATWGFKDIELDYSLTNVPISFKVKDWNTKQETEIKSILGLVGFKATFFHPKGEFEITNSIKIFTDNNHYKIDDNYAKKVETDALTKALSKLGFNSDIFLGKFEDVKYLAEVTEEFRLKQLITSEQLKQATDNLNKLEKLTTPQITQWDNYLSKFDEDDNKKELVKLFNSKK